MIIKEWSPGLFPIPFFQTWCCQRSSVSPPPRLDTTAATTATAVDEDGDIFRELSNAGLPPKMYDCVRSNLLLNRVGVDCIHYLFLQQQQKFPQNKKENYNFFFFKVIIN